MNDFARWTAIGTVIAAVIVILAAATAHASKRTRSVAVQLTQKKARQVCGNRSRCLFLSDAQVRAGCTDKIARAVVFITYETCPMRVITSRPGSRRGVRHYCEYRTAFVGFGHISKCLPPGIRTEVITI